MITIISTVAVTIAVILVLAFLIVGAEYKLVNRDDVNIIINNDEEKPMVVESGSTLLSTLSENEILLPSACGGGGTCGVCLCKVEEGEEIYCRRKRLTSTVRRQRKGTVSPARLRLRKICAFMFLRKFFQLRSGNVKLYPIKMSQPISRSLW